MTQAIRQSELFAAEDWRKIYKAFTQVNFSAYDFTTIRQSLVDYIRFNFPEDFNDWIESSEFVSLIDLLAYLGQSLAFRMDLNARENFIDTAERRESLLRMARLLSYVPSRNIPARGLVKVMSISTNEPLYDSLGQSLQNLLIEWNDANNLDWYEQWTLIMNSVFSSTNPFGIPVKQGTISGIPTQMYAMDSIPTGTGTYSFSTTVEGESLPFEVVNVDFNDGTSFFEREPNPVYSMNLLYQNDGNGNASPNTGFFFYVKQGTLNFQDFYIENPIANRVIDVNVNNVNQFDVWVHTIDSTGLPITSWTKVPAVTGSNIVFNSLNASIFNIFAVNTKDNDQISIRFADGIFGAVPTGNIRVYYRVSANSFFTVQPRNMQGIGLSIPYYNSTGQRYTLSIVFDLQSSISNSASSETIEQIRLNAPQVYYTQNRMVNGEDYNVFPLQDASILKLKAINRTYSGHSRYIDINDPTSTYQDTNVLADDGAIYKYFNDQYEEIPLAANKSPGEIIAINISSMMKHLEMTHFYYSIFSKTTLSSTPQFLWEAATSAIYSSTGQFITANPGTTEADVANNLGNNENPLGSTLTIGQAIPATSVPDMLTEGALVLFKYAGWVKIQNVTNLGQGFLSNGMGAVTLSESVKTNDQILAVYPVFRTDLISDEIVAIQEQIENRNTFGLRYSPTERSWRIIEGVNLAPITSPFSFAYEGDSSLQNLDASWLLRLDYTPDAWQLSARGLQYVWESEKDVRFFANQFYKVVANTINRSTKDKIKVYSTFPKPSTNTEGLGEDLYYSIIDIFEYEDGYQEPRRIVIGFGDSDMDGVPDDPNIFEKLVTEGIAPTDEWKTYIFHSAVTDQYGYRYYVLNSSIIGMSNISPTGVTNLSPEARAAIVTGTIVWNFTDKQFYTFNGQNNNTDRGDLTKYTVVATQSDYSYNVGRSKITFLWNHVASAEHRIDPAITNIIDLFVLTASYDTSYRQWVNSNDTSLVEPSPPTPEQLRQAYSQFEQMKMTSDQMIWKSVKYKPLFGEKANPAYRALFKIVKVGGTTVSDGEIKSRVVNHINTFFDINNWEFGDTFFASELQGYIHAQMPTIVGGVEIVPLNQEARFGNLQQIKCGSDEIFISTAKVTDIEIVSAFTETVLRVGNT